MGRTACTKPQCLYKGALCLFLHCFSIATTVAWMRSNVTFYVHYPSYNCNKMQHVAQDILAALQRYCCLRKYNIVLTGVCQCFGDDFCLNLQGAPMFRRWLLSQSSRCAKYLLWSCRHQISRNIRSYMQVQMVSWPRRWLPWRRKLLWTSTPI